MYPQCPLPRHITALYVVAVTSCIALFSHDVALVGAEVLVYSVDFHEVPEMEFNDMPAHFGEAIPPDGLKGMVVLSQPDEQACSPIQPPPDYRNIERRWIVLIQRYGCSFEQKIRNAQIANYDAAIVHNVNSSDLEPMSAKDPAGIAIPSVFIGADSGRIIKQNYLYNESYFVVITDDLPFNINTHLLLPFAIVVGICFLIMVVFMVVKCIKDRRRQRRHRLPSSSLRKIPTAKYQKGDPYETCAICLEDYQEGEKLRILPCSHAYHSKCIDPWLTRNRRVCPVCKRKVFAEGEQVTDSESESDTDDTTPLVRSGSHGTQGGTFLPQRENPFQRAARRQERSGSVSSSSSAGNNSVSSQSTTTTSNTDSGHTVSSASQEETAGDQGALTSVITSADDHSINSTTEPQEAAEVEDVVVGVTTSSIPHSRNSSPGNKKPDLVV